LKEPKLRFAVDENLDQRIVTALRRHIPGIDLTRVREAGLLGQEDPVILEWVSAEGRVLLTHDVQKMPAFAYERLSRGLSFPGLLAIHQKAPIGAVVADLALVAMAVDPGEIADQVWFLPFAS
jgi:hypothetical protein